MTRPTITIALDWAPNANHTALFVAQRRGFFDAAGVAVTIAPAESRYVAQVVTSGDADLAVAFIGTVIEGRDAGLPLVSLAAFTRRHWSSLVARRDSGITRPADFQGQRYASFGHLALERAVITAMLRADGAPEARFEPRTVRFAAPEALGGEFDFLWIYDGIEGVDAAARGLDLLAWSPADFGVPNYYAPTIFGMEALLADPARRDAGRRFMAALRRGAQSATADPDAGLADLRAAAPAFGGWYYVSEDAARASQHYVSARMAPADGMPWGAQTREEIEPFARFLFGNGGVKTLPDVAALFSNALLE